MIYCKMKEHWYRMVLPMTALQPINVIIVDCTSVLSLFFNAICALSPDWHRYHATD